MQRPVAPSMAASVLHPDTKHCGCGCTSNCNCCCSVAVASTSEEKIEDDEEIEEDEEEEEDVDEEDEDEDEGGPRGSAREATSTSNVQNGNDCPPTCMLQRPVASAAAARLAHPSALHRFLKRPAPCLAHCPLATTVALQC